MRRAIPSFPSLRSIATSRHRDIAFEASRGTGAASGPSLESPSKIKTNKNALEIQPIGFQCDISVYHPSALRSENYVLVLGDTPLLYLSLPLRFK